MGVFGNTVGLEYNTNNASSITNNNNNITNNKSIASINNNNSRINIPNNNDNNRMIISNIHHNNNNNNNNNSNNKYNNNNNPNININKILENREENFIIDGHEETPKDAINHLTIIPESEDIRDTFITWTTSGWIRIYCGQDRSELITIEPSRMIHCSYDTTVQDILKRLNLPNEYTIWTQIGGSSSRRLMEMEKPFQIQEDFFKELGYTNPSRRGRLQIDPEMKYLLRFYIGPSEIQMCQGVTKSGRVDVLKGLVFPQWKKRCVAIIGNHLFIFPMNTYMSPECFNLSGAEVIEHSPVHERLILKIVPKILCENNSNFYLKNNSKLNYKNFEGLNSGMSVNSVYNNNSSCSINSTTTTTTTGGGDREKVLFLGFEESWERDLWSAWLFEATPETPETKRRLDIGNSGLQTIPEIVLQSIDGVEELLAGQNKLQEIGLRALSQFSQLQILRLPGNGFTNFPFSILSISGLKVLDLADNCIDEIPDEISQLHFLEELRIDRNEINELPNTLRFLQNLKSLQASYNRIHALPLFLLTMRTMGLVDMYAQKSEPKLFNTHMHNHDNNNSRMNMNQPLSKVNLRANQLRGHIILGNYGNLTQLDLSENEIETLDLTALGQLESLQCCRNKLIELTLNGGQLTSLIAGNNDLRKLTVIPTPSQLRHLDVSYNNLQELPEWLSGCHQLRTLFANNNRLKSLPEHLFCSELNSLHTLQLGFNELKAIPVMPKRKLPLQELFVQNNEIEELPENFFYACENLVLLNISSNQISTFPQLPTTSSSSLEGALPQLERLYATKNCLNDKALMILMHFKNLRILHAAYNQFYSFPDECVQNWPELEELILSGNNLQHLPDSLSNLCHLKVLRVHSNQLQMIPPLAKISSLRVLDLAHNQLDKINFITLVPKKLQFLDLSCNVQLQVDPKQLQACRSQRPMSLIDVSGKNRPSLPTTPDAYQENADIEPCWKVGFSETAGNLSKLYITQLRLPNFCNTEGLFGMFDGELNTTVPSILLNVIPKILLEERTIKETSNDYMKYTLLSAHRELKQNGQKYGVCATLCHISREKFPQDYVAAGAGSIQQGRKFVLRVASVGEASAFLLRKSENLRLTPVTPRRQIGNSASFPLVIPDPEVSEVILGDQDEYLIICNKKLWEIMDVDVVAKEVRNEENIILAAKRIQDIAQSFGAEENLSIILVKFNNLSTDVDFLIRELRQTVRKKPSNIMSSFCKCGCCCESNNSCCHSAAATTSGLLSSNHFVRQLSDRSDRSSPSGQSDQTSPGGNDPVTPVKLKSDLGVSSTVGSRRSATNYAVNERRSLKGGVVRALRAKIEEEREKEKDETDSALSEEQFKCWEYMLEQNTHVLFDKELNTISGSLTKGGLNSNNSNLIRPSVLSASSPQLLYNDIVQNNTYHQQHQQHQQQQQHQHQQYQQQNSFLSKHFGSARSFHPQSSTLFRNMRFSSGRIPPIGGGPNAAYFGSLQRLMPYNLEYDFAMMQERNADQDDSLEHENRMRQYWGVATTEL